MSRATKYCPTCRGLVETSETEISSTMSLLKCATCGRTLGQASGSMILWFEPTRR